MGSRIIFAAGGTGGHIFPALAVADACRAIEPGAAIEFIGAKGRMEERVVPRAGYNLHTLWISGLARTASLGTALLPLKIGASVAKAVGIMRRFRPQVVVCAGAYVSFPVGLAARLLNVPLVLMESNALPGRVVRKLAPHAREIHVAFEETRRHLRSDHVVTSGNPVRGLFFESRDAAQARRHFGLQPDRPTLFVFGGSLGARSINAAMDAAIDALRADGVQVIWQTGTSYTGGEERGEQLYRATFIHEMDLGYAAADLVVARAGATTIAELAAVGKPAILVPLATAADDHQRINAEALQHSGAATMVLDRDINEGLLPAIRSLMANPELRARMAGNVRRMAAPEADRRIAEHVLAIARNRSQGGK